MQKKYQILFFAVILSAVSFIWLTAHIFDAAPLQQKFHQIDPDSIFFTRLLEQSLLQGKILESDSYACYPYVVKHTLPPFYLKLLVYSTWAIYSFIPLSHIDPIMIAGILPVLFFWFSTVAFFAVVSLVVKDRDFIPFLFFASLPGLSSFYIGRFFYLDYDFLITFCIWAYLVAAALFIKTEKVVFKISGAVITSVFIGTWLGSPLFYFLVTVYCAAIWIAKEEFYGRILEYCSVSMIIGAVVNVFLVSDVLSFSLSGYSLFQPLCVFAGGVFSRFICKNEFKTATMVEAFFIILALSVLMILFMAEPLKQATGFLFRKDPLHSTINELRPVIKLERLAVEGEAASEIFRYFSWPAFLLPIIFLFAPVSLLGKELRFLNHWLGILTAMAFYQIRYIRWLGVGAGLLGAMALFFLWKASKKMFEREQFCNVKLALAFFPLLIIYSLQQYNFAVFSKNISEESVEMFNWIQMHTPETSGYADDKKPEYSFLTFWDEGNLLSYYCRRPVAVGNYILGYKTKADIFASSDEPEAYNLCRKYGVKYILISSRQNRNVTYDLWQYLKKQPEGPEYRLIYTDIPPAVNYKEWFYSYLSKTMGLAGTGKFGVSSRFRVVYASKSDPDFMPANTIYEVVDGAEIFINAEPGANVSLSLEFKVSEKPLIYSKNAVVDDSGNCSIIVPYSTSSRCGRVETDNFYKLMIAAKGVSKKYKVYVSEEDVVKGKRIDLKSFETVDEE